MRTSNEEKIYGYDGNIPLTKQNWKCATCAHFSALTKPCYTGYPKQGVNFKTVFPNKQLEPFDACDYYDVIKKDEITLMQQMDENAAALKYIEQNKDNIVGENIIIPEPQEVEPITVDEKEYTNFKEDVSKKFNNLHDELQNAMAEGRNYSVNTSIPNTIEVKREGNGRIYTATVQLDPTWDNYMKELAIEKSTAALDEQITQDALKIAEQEKEANKLKSELSDADKEQLRNTKRMIDKLLGAEQNKYIDEQHDIDGEVDPKEEMLDGETTISWFNQVTSWNRVINAARRTIGKTPIEKEPSDSWKAKILLAEHSPIRLLEYDWGWEKIRQWVTVHLVRHHIGVEKFVHSQRGDRRELPCDRDHIYQGAKNDMDMTANAQGLINMSRKRCCNCASKETREAWKLVLDELEKKDPILRSKCVRECVYRGFCPEWMSKCGYWKTDAFKRDRAEYVNTKFGKDVKYSNFPEYGVIVTNTGHVYHTPDILKNHIGEIDMVNHTFDISKLKEVEYKTMFAFGYKYIYVTIVGETIANKAGLTTIPVAELVIKAFTENTTVAYTAILHLDGNEWNNNIDNLKVIEQNSINK